MNYIKQPKSHVSEKNTAVIVHNQDINTQKILDRMAYDEIRELTAKVNETERLLSEQRVVGAINASLQPSRPIPAYQVPSPYAGYGQH